MQAVTEIHLVVGFLVVLCGLVFSWTAMGRRVMNAVVGLQILIGLVLAGMLGGAIRGFGPTFVLHVVAALIAVTAYGVARPLAARSGPAVAMAISAVGLAASIGAVALGWHMAGRL